MRIDCCMREEKIRIDIICNELTVPEYDAIRLSNFEFALFDDGCSGYLLFRTAILGWQSAVFHCGVQKMYLEEPDMRYEVELCFDSKCNNSRVRVLRLFTLSPAFSRAVLRLHDRQRYQLLDEMRWNDLVSDTRRLLTPQQMAKQASHRCRNGD